VSRSFKKHPMGGITSAPSERAFKQSALTPKDGKRYFGVSAGKTLRK